MKESKRLVLPRTSCCFLKYIVICIILWYIEMWEVIRYAVYLREVSWLMVEDCGVFVMLGSSQFHIGRVLLSGVGMI
jgi:hypothetical protein